MTKKIQKKHRFFLIEKWKTKLGFSFIELFIALAIFSVGILGIISLQGISLFSTDFSGNMSAARLLASDQIERLTGLPYTNSGLDDCGSTVFCHKDSGSGIPGGQVNLDYTGGAIPSGKFRREWDVNIVETNLKQLTVRVFWSDLPGEVTNAPAHSFTRSLQMTSTKIGP